ncbi:hypothetical protein LINGRAHAP2_LOCUS2209 [Linum grandiflorum]
MFLGTFQEQRGLRMGNLRRTVEARGNLPYCPPLV